jgi:hypothetical protein
MNIEHLLEVHTEARRIKEHWWHDHQEPDPPPMLCVRWQGQEGMLHYVDTVTVAGMLNFIHRAMPTMPLVGIDVPPGEQPAGSAILYISLAALRDGIGLPGVDKPPPKGTPIEEIWLNDEGYTYRDGHRDVEKVTIHDALALHHGDLEADFRTNPMSDVIEEMTTYIVRTDPLGLAEWGRAVSTFYKDDGGVIIWNEPMVTSSDNPPEGYDIYLEVMKAFVIREALA